MSDTSAALRAPRVCAMLDAMMSAQGPDRVAQVDAVSIALAAAGILSGNLLGLPPDAQAAQLMLLFTGLAAALQVIRDRRAAARHETFRTFQPTGKRLAGTLLLLGVVVVPVALYVSSIPGHGWIAIGYLLIGMGMTAPLLVANRKTSSTDPVGNRPY
ncbi:hypothetical protein [Arthrobacter sp. Edens01]|uniref:hypothetical protein n=1 Tax=Arthrobacter sp. Edens01 TaxID=1732020 RepID=UPI0006DC8E11|nr:hypothetical protein [Arthrobacter sp. Edens01]